MSGVRWQANTVVWLSISAALIVAPGCNQSEFPLIPVSGTVKFDGGSCPGPGNVTLQPLEIAKGLPKRPASGKFNTDGAFAVRSFNETEGVLPGRYRVVVSCVSGGPDFSKKDPWGAVNYIAESYQPAELTIAADSGPVVYDVDLPRRKESPQ